MRVDQLQRQLGHSNINTTLRYVHWVPDYQTHSRVGSDLISELQTVYCPFEGTGEADHD
jgi:hypothetical protein